MRQRARQSIFDSIRAKLQIAQRRTAPKAEDQMRSPKTGGPGYDHRGQWSVRFFPGVDAARNVTGSLQAGVLRRLHSHRRALGEGAVEDDSFASRGSQFCSKK
jgi:hypothetical protein